jgi:hypothetical protein
MRPPTTEELRSREIVSVTIYVFEREGVEMRMVGEGCEMNGVRPPL